MELDLIQYYCREQYYHTMQLLAKSASEKYQSNAMFKFQYCVSLILEDELNEAMKQLETLMYNSNVGIAAILAMIYVQNQSEIPDGEILLDLESRLTSERKNANELSLFCAANFYLQLRDFDKAQEYNELLFRVNRNSAKGYLIKGWIEIKNKRFTKAMDYFQSVISQDGQSIDAYLGQIAAQSPEDALLNLNQLIVKNPNLVIVLIEKIKLQLANKQWDQIPDATSRIILLEPTSLITQQFKILHRICVNGDYNGVLTDLQEFIENVEQQEPKGWRIMHRFSALISRVCSCSMLVLNETIRLMEKAISLSPQNTLLLAELGYQYLLIRNCHLANANYKKAAKIDNTMVNALIGLTKCNICENGLTTTVKQQVEFLFEIHNNLEPSAELLLLQVTCKPNDASNEKLINQAIETKFKLAKQYNFGIDYLITLNSNFVLEAIEQYPESENNREYRLSVIKRLINDIPGLIKARIFQAKIEMELNDFKSAETTVKYVLENIDHLNVDANLTLAEILIHQGEYDEADSNLELCLSQNLNVRLKPLFHFLNGIIQKNRKNYSECISCMQSALNNISDTEKLKPSDLATLYLEMSTSYQHLDQANEAVNAMEEASKLLKGTSHENLVTLAQSDLALYRGNSQEAIELLKSVSSDSPSYYEARMKMADIFLYHNKDKKKFAECYEELANANPTQENLIKLAEAFFSVRKINKAIETYERALKQKTSPKLSCKLAELYVKIHQYGKAIRCYREAGSEGGIRLAELLLRLEQLDVAENSLNSIPLPNKALILSKVKEKSGDMTEALNILRDAYEKVNRSNPMLTTLICCQMAQYEANIHDYESAVRHYQLALSHSNNLPQQMTVIQISLAKLYLQMNDWNACKSMCSTLLSREPDNEVGMLLLADMTFRKGDFQLAGNLFEKLLKKRPTYWLALARLIEIKRRTGCLKEAKHYIDTASEMVSSDIDAGFSYCVGLYNWYNYNISDAVKYFNFIRHDTEWGQQAVHNMVEICIAGDGQEKLAQSLLEELRPSSSEEEISRRLLTNFVLLSTKDRQAIEKAMSEFTLLAARDILRVGASLGLAMGYMLQKQPQRARNVLKIIAKTSWQYEEAEYLEKCWVMLASHYIQSNKYELTNDLLKRILTYNQSSSKALEFCGTLAEKNQNYDEACSYYQQAWMYSSQNDPELAFLLASTLLKARRYVETITVCQDILKKDPDNSRVRREVYDKALTLLRT